MDKKNSLKEKKRKLNKTHSVVVTCENEGSQINDLFDDMEKSVKVMESYVISDVFKRSPVFRIGGDEFLAVLRHGDLEDCEKLFIQLDLECANTFVEKKSKIPISIALWVFLAQVGIAQCSAYVFIKNGLYKSVNFVCQYLTNMYKYIKIIC